MPPGDYTPIDTLITDYCDHDSNWGPLLFLRPARSEHLGVARCVVIALLPGIFFGLLCSIVYALIARPFAHPPLPIHVLPILFSAAIFAGWRLVLAPSWNRRAMLLMGRRGR
ncbi:MAG TPA: hypothetical protein VK524_05345 [Polyangiaceae bacterium]|nr:hypothetical protein [Polyangiaceae bacterium]